MTKEQALAILKQPDRIGCHLIKANDEESNKYNQESIEALNIAIKSVNKLGQIEQIIANYGITLEIINHADDGDFSDFEIDIVREVLENE